MTDDQLHDGNVGDKTTQEKIALAGKVGRMLQSGIEGAKRDAAEQLARLLAKDATQSVRKSLADELLACPFMPGDIAQRIANDVDDVASLFLMESQMNVDGLEKLARECKERAREILAARDGLPEPVSFAISEVGEEGSVGILMENKTAQISERVCSAVTDRFQDSPAVIEKLAAREDLPLNSVINLIEHVSEDLADSLVKGYGLGTDLAHYVAGQAKSGAINKTLSEADDAELIAYFTDLKKDKMLNDGMLLQMVKEAKLREFGIAVAVRADIAPAAAAKIITQGEKGHVTRLLEKAHVGNMMVGVLRDALKEASEKPQR